MAQLQDPTVSMRLKGVFILCLLICACVMAMPMQPQTAGDPLSGIWEADWGPAPDHRMQQTVELKWDGKKAVTGVIYSGPLAIKIQKGSFDGNTGALHLEADAFKMGTKIHYVIEGSIEKSIVFGTWKHGEKKGDFVMTRRKS